MRVYKTHCKQRGCDCQVQSDAPPENCPACNNPLLEGGVVDVTAADPPPPLPPPPAPPSDGA